MPNPPVDARVIDPDVWEEVYRQMYDGLSVYRIDMTGLMRNEPHTGFMNMLYKRVCLMMHHIGRVMATTDDALCGNLRNAEVTCDEIVLVLQGWEHAIAMMIEYCASNDLERIVGLIRRAKQLSRAFLSPCVLAMETIPGQYDPFSTEYGIRVHAFRTSMGAVANSLRRPLSARTTW